MMRRLPGRRRLPRGIGTRRGHRGRLGRDSWVLPDDRLVVPELVRIIVTIEEPGIRHQPTPVLLLPLASSTAMYREICIAPLPIRIRLPRPRTTDSPTYRQPVKPSVLRPLREPRHPPEDVCGSIGQKQDSPPDEVASRETQMVDFVEGYARKAYLTDRFRALKDRLASCAPREPDPTPPSTRFHKTTAHARAASGDRREVRSGGAVHPARA